MNHVSIVGRLTADPVLSKGASGIEYLRATVAVNRPFKSRTGETIADFIGFSAWNQTAVYLSKYAKKGDIISILGSIETSTYTNPNDNKLVYNQTVRVNNASIISSNRNNQNAQSTNTFSYSENHNYQNNFQQNSFEENKFAKLQDTETTFHNDSKSNDWANDSFNLDDDDDFFDDDSDF
ncbi:single-stranded DNA-binding protein [Mycoplasmopsis agassizii]|uniref:single-stranded DNA-binding protein n=1 Tax=Mycoplasmopsis agassizii TaxID=33922 RepID=UPI0035276444